MIIYVPVFVEYLIDCGSPSETPFAPRANGDDVKVFDSQGRPRGVDLWGMRFRGTVAVGITRRPPERTRRGARNDND